jgi:manganese/iron transport system substrate-binding protein
MILDKQRTFGMLALTLVLGACGHGPTTEPAASPSSGLVVVVTTSTIGSLVHAVAGDLADVQVLVPVGVSPETYEPRPSDIVALSKATVVFENGAGLESWLGKLIRTSAPNAHVVILSDAIPQMATAAGQPPAGIAQAKNPHFWLDPNYAELYVARIARELAAADPPHAQAYRANAHAEIDRLALLDRWTRSHIAVIPPDRRAMIAFHDAWYYFDRRYGIRDVGAIEPSPGREPSAADLASLVEIARANHVHAIFAEPEFSPRLANQLAESAGISTVTDLYDDSLGTTPGLTTYEGMMRHNVDTIVQALRS